MIAESCRIRTCERIRLLWVEDIIGESLLVIVFILDYDGSHGMVRRPI